MPRRRINRPEPTVIENQAQVDDLCARARSEGRFAFDTEFVMEDRFATEVCLIQIATSGYVAIIDPFLDVCLDAVWELVADDQVETVVHAGQEDLALCVQHTKKAPQRVYDVQIAAGLAGLEYPLSLQRLVQNVLHVRLHKSKTLADWRKRPLTEGLIVYGAEDVCYLLAIQDFLNGKLGAAGREHNDLVRVESLLLHQQLVEHLPHPVGDLAFI